jgi:hypothetical protein
LGGDDLILKVSPLPHHPQEGKEKSLQRSPSCPADFLVAQVKNFQKMFFYWLMRFPGGQQG